MGLLHVLLEKKETREDLKQTSLGRIWRDKHTSSKIERLNTGRPGCVSFHKRAIRVVPAMTTVLVVVIICMLRRTVGHASCPRVSYRGPYEAAVLLVDWICRASEGQNGTEIIHGAAESYGQQDENEALGKDRHLECLDAKE